MREYRIIIETEESGKKWYYFQYKFLNLFWLYHREIRDMSMSNNRVGYHSIEEVYQAIKYDIDHIKDKAKQKIVKRQKFYPCLNE